MEVAAEHHRCVLNHLTAIKLALQALERKTPLSGYQSTLARTALEATDGLASELLGSSSLARSAQRPSDRSSRRSSTSGYYSTGSVGGSPASSRNARRT